jgi:threonine/homoserine/homoserine lactone efflux protein
MLLLTDSALAVGYLALAGYGFYLVWLGVRPASRRRSVRIDYSTPGRNQ